MLLCELCVISATSAYSLSVQVRTQAMDSALAAEAALLVAAEGGTRVELVVRVEPHDASVKLPRDVEDLRALVGPDARGQAVGRVVGAGDRLLGSAEGHDGEHRAEDLV